MYTVIYRVYSVYRILYTVINVQCTTYTAYVINGTNASIVPMELGGRNGQRVEVVNWPK